MPYQKTKEGRLVNEITLGDGYPLSNDLQPLKIGGEASVIEISHPLPDGSDNGLFKVNGDLDITGTLKTKLSHDLIYDFDDEVNTLAQAKVDALIDSAPAALDTLNELAAALGDDANFATTVTNSLALKAPLAAPAFTGNATFDSTTLAIDATNNRVGIGTTSPLTPLHIESSVNALSDRDEPENYHLLLRNPANDTDEGVGLAFLTSAATDDVGASIIFKRTGSAAKGELQFYVKATTDTDGPVTQAMTIDDSANVGIGTTSPTTTLDVEGTVSYKHTAFSSAGPTDNIDVSDTTVLEVDTSSNNVIIGGFTGGVQGQILYIVKTNTANFIQLEHNEGGGSQDIFITTGADERVVGYGGYTLYCNGTSWFSLSNPTGGADAG
jgi:hypothetical protein